MGFTLLEMLVVLLLTALITGILMQALAQVFALDRRFSRELFNAQQGSMYREWFRLSVAGLMPEHVDGKRRFKGSRSEIEGLTLAPLDASTPSVMPFRWVIAYNSGNGRSELLYGAERAQGTVLSWPGSSGSFSFLDDRLEAHDAWPPPLGGPWPQLPSAIRLEYRDAEASEVVIAIPKGLREPLPRFRDLD